MDPQTRELWIRLQTFDFDAAPAAFTFRDRLARDNGWTRRFAARVVEEYRRFLLLGAAAGHPVTPSDEVDQAWHLHLTYTRSYWDELCGQVLPGPLHHGPTRGGPAERIKFGDWYARTLASYSRFFGEEPPADIWPPAAVRFGRAPHYRRVDASSVWLVPKPAWWLGRQPLAGLLLLGFGVTAGCAAASGLPVALLAAAGAVLVVVVALRRQRHGLDRRSHVGVDRQSAGAGDGAGIPFWTAGAGGKDARCDEAGAAGDVGGAHEGGDAGGEGGSGCGSSGCGGGGCGGGCGS